MKSMAAISEELPQVYSGLINVVEEVSGFRWEWITIVLIKIFKK